MYGFSKADKSVMKIKLPRHGGANSSRSVQMENEIRKPNELSVPDYTYHQVARSFHQAKNQRDKEKRENEGCLTRVKPSEGKSFFFKLSIIFQ